MHRDPTLQLVLETALDGVIVMRPDGALADWNGQAEQMFGWPREEVAGRQMSELIIPPRYREAHYRGLKHYLATGEGPILGQHVEITALRRSGEEFPIELSIRPVRRGEEVIFLGFARDITERQLTAKALTRQAREAVLLHRVTTLAAETSSLDDVVRLCLESICELIGWPIGHAYLPGPPGSGALVGSMWTGDVAAFPDLHAATEATSFTRGFGLPGRVWETREPIWLSDVRQSEMFPRGGGGDIGVRSAFCLPIITGGEVVAVLEFFGPEPVERDQSLMLTAQSMGEQVGRVLERRRVQEHQTLLLAELDHRAKNMLAVVMGMAAQTARNAPSVEHFTASFFDRLQSLSRAYGLLTSRNWRPTTLEDLVREVLTPHLAPDQPQLTVCGGELLLPPKFALSVSMILHELTTNAAKYGALRQADGRIFIDAAVERRAGDAVVRLTWREEGSEIVQPPARKGFGSKLIEASAHHELAGHVTVTYEPHGIRYDFEFPKPA